MKTESKESALNISLEGDVLPLAVTTAIIALINILLIPEYIN